MRRLSVLLAVLPTVTVMMGCEAVSTPARPTTSVLASGPAPNAIISTNPLTFSWHCLTTDAIPAPMQGCPTPRRAMQLAAAGSATAPPGPPTNLSFFFSGTTVTLTWVAPSGPQPVTDYYLEAGTSSGATNLGASFLGSTATTLTAPDVPPLTYFVRIRAVNSAGVSAPSNEITFTGRGNGMLPPCDSAPNAPTGLAAVVNGQALTLTWNASTAGCAATSFTILAGSRSGLSDLGVINTGNAALTFSASGVSAGTYYVRVRATNNGGTSAPSNEAVITVSGSGACRVAPNAPTGLAAFVNGTSVTLTWNAPASGCPPTSFTIQAGSRSGLSDLTTLSTGNTATTYSAGGIGNGTYYVRILATNGSGASGPSNEATLTIGPVLTLPPPGQPTPDTPLTGTFTGSWNWLGPGPNGCSFDDGGSISMTLTQSGNAVSGSIRASGVQTRRESDCALMSVDTVTGSLSGTYSGGLLVDMVFDLQGTQNTLHFTGSAYLQVNVLTGSFRRSSGGLGNFSVLKRAQ